VTAIQQRLVFVAEFIKCGPNAPAATETLLIILWTAAQKTFALHCTSVFVAWLVLTFVTDNNARRRLISGAPNKA
jgi:hypothetical protein